MRTAAILLVIFGLSGITAAYGQQDQANDITEQYNKINRLIANFSNEIIGIPPTMSRIALFDLDYDERRISEHGARVVQNRIRQALNDEVGINAVTLPKQSSDNYELNIEGDSALVITNRLTNDFDTEYAWLRHLAQEYNVDGFLEGDLHYDEGEFILNVSITSPSSRDAAWNETVYSFDVDDISDIHTAHVLFKTGVGVQSTTDYIIGGDSFTGEYRLLSYAARMSIRTRILEEGSSYFGISFGAHRAATMSVDIDDDDSNNYMPYSTNFASIGAIFYQSIAEKEQTAGAHWLDYYISANAYGPLNPNNLYGINQGFTLNLTNHLGLAFNLEYILNTSTLSLIEDGGSRRVDLNNINYGIQLLLRL